ncbi:MAG: hypothetical protein IMZ67_00455 [Acidobacteria bacterium]|nr:hypothetical protein [Acidobacteriota bacterium]
MERDLALCRFERDALIVWGGLTAVAFVATRGRVDVAVGVIAGGALMALSYLGIKSGGDVLAAAIGPRKPYAEHSQPAEDPGPARDDFADPIAPAEEDDASGPRRHVRSRALVIAALKFLGRYALLAVLAYVMLTRLRLHPVGVVIGVSVPAVAAAMQLVRAARSRSRPHHPA